MNTPLDKAKFVVCDVETTGLNPRFDSIIEIALVKIENLKIVDKFTTLVNPERPIPYFITQLTGITNSHVQNSPTFSEISFRIKDFLKDSIFVAHNAKFDYGFLTHSFLKNEEYPIQIPTICTRFTSKRIFPGLKSYSLDSLLKFMKIKNPNAHRALGDALSTAHLFFKMIDEVKLKHGIKSAEELIKLQYQPISKLNEIKISKSIAEKIPQLPKSPGVYLFRNRKGDIIYIGKAKNLRNRVLSYFRNNGDKRNSKIVRSAHYLDFIETATELSAFLLESELIKTHKPKLNKALKIIRRYSFIGLDYTTKYPRLVISTNFSNHNTIYFGPFQRRNTAEQVLEILSKSTMLRECDDKSFNKNRPCYLLDIKRCLGPCINSNIEPEYQNEVKVVKSFLTGDNLSILNRLTEKMKKYSQRQKFEDAAKIRDIIQAILHNIGRIKVLREPINSINAIIIIYDFKDPREIIALKNGIVIFIKEIDDDIENLESIVEEYFAYREDSFDLSINTEKIKIISNFLVNKKAQYNVIYTSNLTQEEIFQKLKNILMEK